MAVGRRYVEAEHDGQLWCYGAGSLNSDAGVLYVENGLDEQQVDTAVAQGLDLFGVSLAQCCGKLFTRSLYLFAYYGTVGRTYAAGYVAGLVWRRELVGTLAGQPCGGDVDVADVLLQSVVAERYALCVEGVRLDNVCTGLEVLAVYVGLDERSRQHQHVVAAAQVGRVLGKATSPEVLFAQVVLLNHGAHGAVEEVKPTPIPSRREGGFLVSIAGFDVLKTYGINIVQIVSILTTLNLLNNLFYFPVSLLITHTAAESDCKAPLPSGGGGGGLFGGRLSILLHNPQRLFHFALVVKVHLQMYAVAADVVEQGAQLVERHPAGHDALPGGEYATVEVVPLRAAALWLAYAGGPLYGVQLVDFQQRVQVMHGSHTVEVVEGVVYSLALLADERLHEATVVVLTDHGRQVALQFRHPSRCPQREIAEGHLVALTDDVVQLVEHAEVYVVDLLQLSLQQFGLHHRVEQHLVGALQCSQHVQSLHQVGHAYVVVPLCLTFARLQQFLVQQPVGMLRVERDVVGEVWVRVNPDGVLAALEHAAQYGSQRSRPQLRVSHGQDVGHQRRVGHIPVQIVGSPLRVEPPLVQVAAGRRCRHVGVGRDALLEVLPHVDYNTLVVPPVYVVAFGFFEVGFPSIHHRCLTLFIL